MEIATDLTASELKVLRDRYRDLADVEFNGFLAAAQRYRLSPIANQIYARLQKETAKTRRTVTYVCQIDGYRLIADRTGAYAGNDDPIFDNEAKPTRATVAVYKLVGGEKCKFVASARMSQYKPSGNAAFMWDRMPHLMLGKCGEALALRKAFPAELSGLYTVEEMQQADPPEPPETTAQRKARETRSQQQQQPAQPPALESEPANWPNSTAEEIKNWLQSLKNPRHYPLAAELLRQLPTQQQRLLGVKLVSVLYHAKLAGSKNAEALEPITQQITEILQRTQGEDLAAQGKETFQPEEPPFDESSPEPQEPVEG